MGGRPETQSTLVGAKINRARVNPMRGTTLLYGDYPRLRDRLICWLLPLMRDILRYGSEQKENMRTLVAGGELLIQLQAYTSRDESGRTRLNRLRTGTLPIKIVMAFIIAEVSAASVVRVWSFSGPYVNPS